MHVTFLKVALLAAGALGLLAAFTALLAPHLERWLVERERAADVLDSAEDLSRRSRDAIAPESSRGPRHPPGVRPAFRHSYPSDGAGAPR